MAGQQDGVFKEKLSDFLREKLEEARSRYGSESEQARILELQYTRSPEEDVVDDALERDRHYHAEMPLEYSGRPLRGTERLYRRVIVVEPTTVCAAHCRWCLRGQYPIFSLTEEELERTARFCGDEAVCRDVREVLVTGGDPLMVPDRLNFFVDALAGHAPNVRVVRVGTRLPLQDPARVTRRVLHALRPRPGLRVEVGTHINHSGELFDACVTAHRRIRDTGAVIYNQAVLLKRLNDTPQALADLCDALRDLEIEAHYLFHCVPMKGMHAHRTTVEKGLRLMTDLAMSGRVSGRSKPAYTVMTDIGKITLYQGTILEKDPSTNRILLQSGYSLEERRRWNPSWELPDSCIVDEEGRMRVWYLDGSE